MLAILYDIHANLPALERVLEEADRAGTERVTDQTIVFGHSHRQFRRGVAREGRC